MVTAFCCLATNMHGHPVLMFEFSFWRTGACFEFQDIHQFTVPNLGAEAGNRRGLQDVGPGYFLRPMPQ